MPGNGIRRRQNYRRLSIVPYVVGNNKVYIAPADIPPYRSNPQGPGSKPFRAWPFPNDRAGPKWFVESVQDDYVTKEGIGRLQAIKNKCIIGTVLKDIGQTLEAPQAFSGGPLDDLGTIAGGVQFKPELIINQARKD